MERKPLYAEGSRRDAWESAGGRLLAAVLALVLQVPPFLLLRSVTSDPASPREEPERMRLIWSQREPGSMPLAPALKPAPKSSARSYRAAARAVPIRAPDPAPRDSSLQLALADDWAAMSITPGHGADFKRRIFDAGEPDAFAPEGHLPGVRLRDSSLVGQLHAEARRRACGELRGAISQRPESTTAILASMRRWKCAM